MTIRLGRKGLFVLGVSVFAAIALQAQQSVGPGGTTRGPSADRVYVKFRPGVAAGARAALHAARGLMVEEDIRQVDLHVIRVPPGLTAEDVCAHYARHPLVEFCEPEVSYELQLTPDDPWFANWQKGLQRLGAEAAWDITAGSPAAPIAVVDTGLDYNHFEFLPRVQSGEITGDAFGVDDWYDADGHGTVVTGVIAAITNNGVGIAGAADRAPLMALSALSNVGRTASAIIFAADHGARVINMSYGAYIAGAELTALQYAFDHGVVLVAAAGNQDTETKFYPAAFDIVLAVTGVDAAGKACGFGHGDWIDLAAPCVTLTTFPRNLDSDSDGIGSAGGTSISAPFVAAAAALVLSVNADLSPAQVMDILRSTADDMGDPGFDKLFGYGRVNYYRAVLAARETEPWVDTTPPSLTIAAPMEGATLSGMATVLVNATDDTRVTRVDLHVDGSLLSGDTVPPHEWAFDAAALPDGLHTLSAAGWDAAGNRGESPAVQILVDNTAPSVSLLSPEDGGTVSGKVPVTVDLADGNRIDRVVYLVDGVEAATVTAFPWSWEWDSTSGKDGSHGLGVVARDLAGNAASASVAVTVSNGGDTSQETPVTEVFTGTLNRTNPEQTFQVVMGAPGLLHLEVTFGGGPSNAVDCAVIDPAGRLMGQKVSASPLTLDLQVTAPETCTVRLRKVSKNVSFTLEATHP